MSKHFNTVKSTFDIVEEDRIEIEKILEKDQGIKYNNATHFIRVAIRRLIKEEGGLLKR